MAKNETEDGEFDNVLSFPPRPIVPKQDAEYKPFEPAQIYQETVEISSALENKIQSLLGEIIICHKPWANDAKECKQCSRRLELVDIIRTQIKAELSTLFDLRRKLRETQDIGTMLKTFINLHHGNDEVEKIIQEYRQAHILKIK